MQWTDAFSKEEILFCNIIVSGASAWMEPHHERMPVMFAPADFNAWLDSSLCPPRRGLPPNPHCGNGHAQPERRR
ncbi:SOS response-associated peptidase family protein [Mycoplana dimorpha]|uniref:SOS response-associated peptidase family protein n=1 Tax=Mycoplana dimorpha TaxID=28320 RepID=UPI000D395984